MTKLPYADKFKADQQLALEEQIAARIFALTDGTVDEEVCKQIGEDALYIVVRELRRDLLEKGK